MRPGEDSPVLNVPILHKVPLIVPLLVSIDSSKCLLDIRVVRFRSCAF
jgi:hypothetical protein